MMPDKIMIAYLDTLDMFIIILNSIGAKIVFIAHLTQRPTPNA